jgi:hypothetical protein
MGRTGEVQRFWNVSVLIKYKRAEDTQRHSSWATGWETGGFWVRFAAGANICLPPTAKIVSGGGAHTAFCLMGTESTFPRRKAVVAWSWLFIFTQCRMRKICLSGSQIVGRKPQQLMHLQHFWDGGNFCHSACFQLAEIRSTAMGTWGFANCM